MITGESVKKGHSQYNLQSWSKQRNLNPLAIEKTEGIYLYDFEGERYTDMSSQLVNMNLGHSCKEIVDAIKEQADKFCFLMPSYAAESRSVLAQKLVDIMPDNIGKVFFTNGGADANENALKAARMYTGRNKVFSRYRSYHGSTFGAGNLTGEPRRFACEPGIAGFVKFFDPYVYREQISFASDEEAGNFYLGKLREQILYEGPEQVAAIFLETVTGSNGVIIPPGNYLPGVRKLCDEFGIIMVLDEVMTGFGRTGKMFAFEHWGVKPDIIAFAKGVTCGYVQLGGMAVSGAIAEYFDDNTLMCGLTYSGHPLACAAGVACVDYFANNDVLGNVNKVGKVLGDLLEDQKNKHASVGDVRYIGLFSAVELVRDKATKEPLVPYGKDPDGKMGKILGLLRARKFLTYTHENMILIAPPLIITGEQIREEIAKLDEVLTIVDREMR